MHRAGEELWAAASTARCPPGKAAARSAAPLLLSAKTKSPASLLRAGRAFWFSLFSPATCSPNERERMTAEKKGGDWQRPTFAHPFDALSSGLQRFTSVFEMGTGGTTARGSPEGWPAPGEYSFPGKRKTPEPLPAVSGDRFASLLLLSQTKQRTPNAPPRTEEQRRAFSRRACRAEAFLLRSRKRRRPEL